MCRFNLKHKYGRLYVHIGFVRYGSEADFALSRDPSPSSRNQPRLEAFYLSSHLTGGFCFRLSRATR